MTTNSQNVTLNNGFTVTAGTPVITQINPNIGNPGQTLNVTSTANTPMGARHHHSQLRCPGITVNTADRSIRPATSLTVNITIGAGTAPLGPVEVQTTTGERNGERAWRLYCAGGIVFLRLRCLLLSPGPNVGGMPINSTIIARLQPADGPDHDHHQHRDPDIWSAIRTRAGSPFRVR